MWITLFFDPLIVTLDPLIVTLDPLIVTFTSSKASNINGFRAPKNYLKKDLKKISFFKGCLMLFKKAKNSAKKRLNQPKILLSKKAIKTKF